MKTPIPGSQAPPHGTVPPRVSVIVPTHNRALQLRRCLKALLGQAHPSFEIVVVDDGSTDCTPLALRRIVEAHPDAPLRILRPV